MKDKDSQLIYEAYTTRGWDMYDKHYMGHELEAIGELINYLKSKYEEGKHFKVHVGYGDDLPNTVEVHQSLRKDTHLVDLLDGASGEPEGEGEDADDWFDHDEPKMDPDPWSASNF